MLRFFKIFILILTLFFIGNKESLASSSDEVIRLTVPGAIIAETVQSLLPFDLATDSGSLVGTITIAEVRNLQFDHNLISCELHLIGRDLNLITKIAGQAISLRVGEMELDFSTDITSRFDRESNTLMLTPRIRTIAKSRDQADGHLGKTLVALFDHKEFPVELDKIKPFTISTGNKTVDVKLQIRDAQITPDGLQLQLIPITVTPPAVSSKKNS